LLSLCETIVLKGVKVWTKAEAVLNQSMTTLSSGLVNVANSLAVIKKLCFEDKICDWSGMKTAIKNNWVGYEKFEESGTQHAHIGAMTRIMFDDIYLELV